jgi:hypothetical protein
MDEPEKAENSEYERERHFTKSPHIYSKQIDEMTKGAVGKSFVLIETTSNEEHNLAMSLLKTKFPSASVFSSKNSYKFYEF